MKEVRWITVTEVAEMVGTTRSTVEKWMKRGVAPKWRKLPNRRVLFDVRDVEEWLDSLVVQ